MAGKPARKEEREQKIAGLVLGLIHSNLKGLARGILKVVRLRLWDEPIFPADHEQKTTPGLPGGPFEMTRRKQRGDLLLFVPRRLNSFIIDDLSGGYGYSHAAVDCGEVDVPTGRPVMIESNVGRPVGRVFLDTYGERRYVRIQLSKAGIDPEMFCEGIKSKLGQPYDNLEALTWGEIDDPAKQVCSDLATVCLPEEIREDIANANQRRLLRRNSVSVHSRPSVYSRSKEDGVHEFISPNGFAEYFGAPKGEDIKVPGQLVIPHKVTSSPVHAALHVVALHGVHQSYWKIGLTVAALAAVTIITIRLRGR